MRLDLKTTEPNHLEATQVKDEAFKKNAANTAEKFESLLVSMMVKSMYSSENGMFGENSMGGDYFETIFQENLSTSMAGKMDLGIASMLYKKITGEDLNTLDKPMKIEGKIGEIPQIPPQKPGMQSLDRINRFESIIKEASEKYQIDPLLIKSVILTESAGNERALSKANAKGLMQLMDGTAATLGVNNSWDPRQNIHGGTKYLSMMLEKFDGDLSLALAGYNAGPGNVQKYNGVPPFNETKSYINRVIGYYNHLKSEV